MKKNCQSYNVHYLLKHFYNNTNELPLWYYLSLLNIQVIITIIISRQWYTSSVSKKKQTFSHFPICTFLQWLFLVNNPIEERKSLGEYNMLCIFIFLWFVNIFMFIEQRRKWRNKHSVGSVENTENEHLKRTMFSLSTLCRQCDDCKTFIVYRKCIWAFNNNIWNPVML